MKNIKPVQTQFTNAIATGAKTASFDYTNLKGVESRQTIKFPLEGALVNLSHSLAFTAPWLKGGSTETKFKMFYLERIKNPVFA